MLERKGGHIVCKLMKCDGEKKGVEIRRYTVKLLTEFCSARSWDSRLVKLFCLVKVYWETQKENMVSIFLSIDMI